MLVALLVLLGFAAPAAAADTDVEGYHDPGMRIGCIMVKRSNATTAVRCGANGRTRGLLLTGTGPARGAVWSWPPEKTPLAFSEIKYDTTYYLYGGTAKLVGDKRALRCTFARKPSVRVRCRNGDGHGIEVTKTKLRKLGRSRRSAL